MEPTERRCPNCFHIVTGDSEYCTTFCADAARDWEESVVVYPVEEKRARLAVVP